MTDRSGVRSGRLVAALGRLRPSYRTLDITSKLAGLGLVAGALEVGPTALGIGLAVAGAALATMTVFLDND